mmetsp:Transcript_12084/g.42385  ORF Transcript_12084/g.42385 Transcript_12084/m.42385 type:complete len:201 (-) Transcript_12084:5838-6440(-)
MLSSSLSLIAQENLKLRPRCSPNSHDAVMLVSDACACAWRWGKGVASGAPALSPRMTTTPSGITACTTAPSLVAYTLLPAPLVARTVANTRTPSSTAESAVTVHTNAEPCGDAAAATSASTTANDDTSVAPAEVPSATAYSAMPDSASTKLSHRKVNSVADGTTSSSLRRAPSDTKPRCGGVKSTTSGVVGTHSSTTTTP